MLTPNIVMLAAIACAGAALLTPIVTAELRRKNIYDHPKEGSGHILPRPLGGGIAVVSIVLAVLLVLGPRLQAPLHFYGMLAAMAYLAGLSLCDDLKGLSVRFRLWMQMLVIVPLALAFPDDFLIFQGVVPLALDRFCVIVAWLGFTNIMNLMDGIDGITGVETGFIGLAAAAIFIVTGAGSLWLPVSAAVVGGAVLGFLIWNWQPARVFMGDVGAIPLGFVCGWILINMAASGLLLPAILLPLFHCLDATMTLGMRLFMHRDLTRRHRSHCFQRAIRAGYTHQQTVLILVFVNVGLFAGAWAAADGTFHLLDILVIALGCLMTGFVMLHFCLLAPIPEDQL